MKITGQTVSVTELIKDTSERFGNRGLSRFISGIQNVSEPRFHCTQDQAELLGTKSFVALRNVFGNSVMKMDMTPFKNISHEINVYRESQSFSPASVKAEFWIKLRHNAPKLLQSMRSLTARLYYSATQHCRIQRITQPKILRENIKQRGFSCYKKA
ncbi:hypothetical protein CKG00_11275 [Morganella morganii]|uniref:Uncharacterized protein n=1 Tax=Morganella morganii TaxID=582 RepID=A0A433ZXS1_MORMO|nr:hypothetical protein CKG00_11275 [Morganella morganii]